MTLYRAELECVDQCGYEAAVSNAIRSAFARHLPETCPRCKSDVEVIE